MLILLRSFLPYILGAGLIFGVVYYIYDKGASDKEEEIRVQSQEQILEDRRKADEAITRIPTNPDGAREWLRRRNESLRH